MSQINITIIDEFEEETQESVAKLDLETGKIFDIICQKGYTSPLDAEDYTFSSGLLKLGAKELEFVVTLTDDDEYNISQTELAEVKQKMASLVSTKKKRM